MFKLFIIDIINCTHIIEQDISIVAKTNTIIEFFYSYLKLYVIKIIKIGTFIPFESDFNNEDIQNYHFH